MEVPTRGATARPSRAIQELASSSRTSTAGPKTEHGPRVLEHVQTRAETLGDLDWIASIDSTIVRVHQHGATLPRHTGGALELDETRTRTALSCDRTLTRLPDV